MRAYFKRFRERRISREVRLENRETSFCIADCIWPAFVTDGHNRCESIASMKNIHRMSSDILVKKLSPLVDAGLQTVLLFGVPDTKAIEKICEGPVENAIEAIRSAYPSIEIISDICICSYTENGHCHVGDNDETCEILARMALSHASAGAHSVAPSAMMDGQVHYIRKALDQAGYTKTRVISYGAKYASHYYGPFRDAADCAPKEGNRRSYQMDPANAQEALLEIEADLEQGAASIIIKPALAYLDIIARAKERFDCQLIAYNVSGEYRMLCDAVSAGYANKGIIAETLYAIKRAGADRIITYFVPELIEKGFDYEE